jgi:hypothetical protein
MTRADALKAYEVVQADWIKAIKAVPALQERIKQNASFANVMTEAARMAETGYARLSMADMKAAAEFNLRVASLPGACENFAHGSSMTDPEIMQYLGVEPFKRQEEIRIRALHAEAAHTRAIQLVSRSEYRDAVIAATRSLPFDDGEKVSEMMQRAPSLTRYEKCWMGHALLQAGMMLPEPYVNTVVIYSLTLRFAPDPAPTRVPDTPGPHLGI